jgi:ribonuclease P protein component
MIPKVLSKGKNIKCNYFYVRLIQDQTETYKQFAFVVSKKVSKKSTKRNRIKRILRSLVYKNLDKIPFGYYVFVVFRYFCSSREIKDFEDCVLRVLSLGDQVSKI